MPAGKALDADFSLDPLPNASIGYAAVSFPEGGDAKAAEHEIRAILAQGRAKTAFPPNLSKPPRCRSGARPNSRRTASRISRRYGPMPSRSIGLHSPEEDLQRIEKVTRGGRQSRRAQISRSRTCGHGSVTPQHSGQPVASNASFGGKENIALGEAKPTDLPDWAQTRSAVSSFRLRRINPVSARCRTASRSIVQPEDVSDTVSVYGHIRNRAETETPPGKDGVAPMLEQLFSAMAPKASTGSPSRKRSTISARASAPAPTSQVHTSERGSRSRRRAARRQRIASGAAGDRRWTSCRSQYAQVLDGTREEPRLSHLTLVAQRRYFRRTIRRCATRPHGNDQCAVSRRCLLQSYRDRSCVPI